MSTLQYRVLFCTMEPVCRSGHSYTIESWAAPGRVYATEALAADVSIKQGPELHLDFSGLLKNSVFRRKLKNPCRGHPR
jgi:hypothetical protein